MLGEQLGELKGKVIARRVVDVSDEGPSIEVSVSREGQLKGVEVTDLVTYTGTRGSDGTIHAHGKGVIMTKDGSEMASFTGQMAGNFTSHSELTYRGAFVFKRSQKGKLEFLNNSVTVFEVEENFETSSHQIKLWKWE
jgi:hypothetical protein